jgi:hypothetical protein
MDGTELSVITQFDCFTWFLQKEFICGTFLLFGEIDQMCCDQLNKAATREGQTGLRPLRKMILGR